MRIDHSAELKATIELAFDARIRLRMSGTTPEKP